MIPWTLQTLHTYRQVGSLEVLCGNSTGDDTSIGTIDVQGSNEWAAVADGWIMLPLEKSCPTASKTWMIRMKAIEGCSTGGRDGVTVIYTLDLFKTCHCDWGEGEL